MVGVPWDLLAAEEETSDTRPRLASPRLAGLLSVGTAVVYLCGCPVGAPEPVTTGAQDHGVGVDPFSGEQAEVALARGSYKFGPTLVAVFNDFSLDSDFLYSPSAADSQSRQVRRGVSVMGRSVSLDVGLTWTYRGKLHPPVGWSAIWGDPSVAADPNSENIVYYVQMAVSDDAWNAATGGGDVTSLSPGRDMVDGFCIARSIDGGVSFLDMECRRVGTGPATVDRTAVTVDGFGRVYVALNTRASGGPVTNTIIFRSGTDWRQLSALPPPARASISEPWLVTDPDGDVWFGARDNGGAIGGDVSVMRWLKSGSYWDHVMSVASNCFVSLGERDPLYALGSGRKLRNAHTFSFAAGLEEQRPTTGEGPPPRRKVLRVALQLQRTDGRTFLVFRQFVVGSTVCLTGAGGGTGWSTEGDSGSQFSPTMSYRALAGNFPGWFATYLTTENVPDATNAYVHPKGVGVATVPLSFPPFFVPVLSRITDLTPTNWFTCPRREIQEPDYWGDYIGIAQATDANNRAWAVAGFSDSSPAPPCDAGTPYLGLPTHVASQRW